MRRVSRRKIVIGLLAAALAAALLVWLIGGDGGGDELGRGGEPGMPAETADREEREREPADEERRSLRCDGSGRGLEVAVQDDAVLLERHYGDRPSTLARARELETTWIRTSVLWSRVASSPGSYDWSSHDALVDAARAEGICVQMSLTGPAPGWATADGREGVNRPDAERFAEFAGATARHFRGRVERYSIWNEPNHVAWLEPGSAAPATYRRLYLAGYGAVKRADPRARVLIGETTAFGSEHATPPVAFLREVACRGRDLRPLRPCEPLEADGYAHHGYDFEHPPGYAYPGADNATLGTLDNLTRTLDGLADVGALRKPGGGRLDVWITEFGYFAVGRRRTPESLRAEYLPRAFELAGARPRVRQMLQYLLVKPPADYPGGNFNTGIIEQDGTPTAAFGSLAAWAREARAEGEIAKPVRR
jgi:hypothetical protein